MAKADEIALGFAGNTVFDIIFNVYPVLPKQFTVFGTYLVNRVAPVRQRALAGVNEPITVRRDEMVNRQAIRDVGAIFAGCCLIMVIGALVPMSEPRIPLNHMRTADSSLQLISAEREYAEKFPASGFTCDLRNLSRLALSTAYWLQVKKRVITTN